MISAIKRRLAAYRFNKQLDRNLAARRAARNGGRVYVGPHIRRK